MKGINKIVNWFVPGILKSNISEIRKAIIFVMLNLSLIGLSILYIIISKILPYYGELSINIYALISILVVNLVFYKIFNKRNINLTILLGLSLLVFNEALQASGGIYSDDVYWLLLIPICATLMNSTLSGVIWTAIISLNMVYFYNAEINAAISFREATLKFSAEYFLFGAILFYTTIFSLISIFKQLTTKYELQLTLKQKQLVYNQKQLVEKQTSLHAQTLILKETELELKKSNEELEKYAYVTSHDLKQPLRTVKSFTGLLKKRLMAKNILDRESNEYIDFIIKSSTNMEELIGTLLEYAKITSSKNITYLKVDLNSVMTTIHNNLAHQIKNANVTIICNHLPTITCIPVKINQLFQNIISNSIKFKKEGVPPIIQITAAEHPNYWEFRVSDNGIGIAQEEAKKIFLPFERSNYSGAIAGTGIGLATCQKIIEFHKGNIRAISEGINNGMQILFTIRKDLENPSIETYDKINSEQENY